MNRSPPKDRSEREAADWLARLNQPVVAQDDLAAFRAWRESPANDQAYRSLQLVWRLVGPLGGDPDVRAALKDAGRRRPRGRSLMLWSAGGGGGAVAAVLAGWLVVSAVHPAGDAYTTAVGERSVIHLADGSTVQLDTDSRLRARLTRGERQLQLTRGQALFDVAHDAARPFVVTAGTLQVTATGTRFDVRREADGGKVVLLQGRVVVRGAGAPKTSWTLSPGQEIASGPKASPPLPGDPEAATGWTTGRLTFRNASLADVVSEANRYSTVRLRLAPDFRLDGVRVDGVFAAGDSPAIAQALGDLYGLRSEPQANGDLVLRPRA